MLTLSGAAEVPGHPGSFLLGVSQKHEGCRRSVSACIPRSVNINKRLTRVSRKYLPTPAPQRSKVPDHLPAEAEAEAILVSTYMSQPLYDTLYRTSPTSALKPLNYPTLRASLDRDWLVALSMFCEM